MAEEYYSLLAKAKKLYAEEKYDEAQELAFTLVRHEDSSLAPFLVVASVAIRLTLIYTAFGDAANADIAQTSLYKMLALGLRRTGSTKEALDGEHELLCEIQNQKVKVAEKFLVALADLQDKMGFISEKGIHTMNIKAAALTLGVSDAIRKNEDFLSLCRYENKTAEEVCEGHGIIVPSSDGEVNALIVTHTRRMLVDTLDYLEKNGESPEPNTGARLISDYYAYDFLISCTMPAEDNALPDDVYLERLNLCAVNLRAMLVSCIICEGNPVNVISENREEIRARLDTVYAKIRSINPDAELPPIPCGSETSRDEKTKESRENRSGVLRRAVNAILARLGISKKQ